MKKLILAFFLFCTPAFAQSTAQPVITGYLSMTGCPSANLTPCFVPLGSSSSSASYIAPSSCTATNTTVTLTAATSATLLAAGNYKLVEFMNIGTNPMTVVSGITTAVVGNGLNYNGSNGTGSKADRKVITAQRFQVMVYQRSQQAVQQLLFIHVSKEWMI